MKTCNLCKLEKPFTEFHKDKKAAGGLCSTCASCKRAKAKEWYAENRDVAKEKRLTHARNNPRTVEQLKESYAKRRQAAIEMATKWRKNNQELCNRNKRNWLKSNPGYSSQQAKKYISALRDGYIKRRLGYSAGYEIPAELIEAKRLHLQLIRKLKELKA